MIWKILVPTVICSPLSPGHVKPEADAEGAAGELDAPTDDAGRAAAVDDQLGTGIDNGRAELAAAADELTDEFGSREAAGTLEETAGDEVGTAAADGAGVTSSAPYTRKLNV